MAARLSDLKRALEKLGVSIEEPTSGSHWKATRGGGPMYPLPAHNGLKSEIDDVYIRKLCRVLGVDEKDLRDLL